MNTKKRITVIVAAVIAAAVCTGIIVWAVHSRTARSPHGSALHTASASPLHTNTPKPAPASPLPASGTDRKIRKPGFPANEALISGSSFYIYVLQTDGTEDKYHVCSDKMPAEYVENAIRSDNWVYYCLDSSETLYRIPIKQRKNKIKLLPKKTEKLGLIRSSDFLYATDESVVLQDEENIVLFSLRTNTEKNLLPVCDSGGSKNWQLVCDCNGQPVVDKDSNLYVYLNNYKTNKRAFYKVRLDTFETTKLPDSTNAVLQDDSCRIVCMESDQDWNYAYYPETGKKYRCGRNMFREWKDKKDAFEFDPVNDEMDSLPVATNRELAGWIRQKNPWSYREKKGQFQCVNKFIYKDRMYVKVRFEWVEPGDEDKEDDDYTSYTEGMMLFSYSLKNYNGIRPETKINKKMQETSKPAYGDPDDDEGWSMYTVTGDFSLVLGDNLVFNHDKYNSDNQHYGLYNLRTHQYKKLKKNNRNYKYITRLQEGLVQL